LNIQKKIIESKNAILNNEIAKKTIKNSGWLVGDKVFTMLIGAFVTAMVARYFGPENFGLYNYALSFTALFTALSTLGLDTLIIKDIVYKERDEGIILCTSLFLKVFGGVVLTILSSIIIRIIEPNDTSLYILVLIMSFTMIFKSTEVIEYWIQAHQRAKISSVIRMFAYVISAGLKIALILMGGNLVQFTLIFMMDSIIVGVALMFAYYKKRQYKIKWKFKLDYAKNILSQSWYLILSGLMVTIYMRIDQVMLGSMLATKTELGVYSAAVSIASMWYFVPMAVIISFQPIIIGKKKINQESYIKCIQLLYTIVAWMGILFGLFIFFFSSIIVNVLFGPEFIKAVSILSMSVWAGTFAMLGSARSTWLICEGLQKYTMVFMGIGAIINVALNYLLIPLLGGNGAAIATLVSQITVSIIVPFFFKDTRISSIMTLKAFKLEGIFKDK